VDLTELILAGHHEQRRIFPLLNEPDRSDTTAVAAIWATRGVHAAAEERVFYPQLLGLGTGAGSKNSAAAEIPGLAWRWAKVGAVIFGVGTVSSPVLFYELGLLWPTLIGRYGAAYGIPFAIEGICFFLEAIFMGIYLYGWRLSPWLHWRVAAVVAAWGWAQYPYLLPHSLSLAADSAPSSALRAELVVAGIAAVLVVPAFGCLFWPQPHAELRRQPLITATAQGGCPGRRRHPPSHLRSPRPQRALVCSPPSSSARPSSIWPGRQPPGWPADDPAIGEAEYPHGAIWQRTDRNIEIRIDTDRTQRSTDDNTQDRRSDRRQRRDRPSNGAGVHPGRL